jgi:outer membrane receptor protein involved in Fe transport
MNYGHFFQIPLFDYMFTGLNYDIKKGVKALYGNPDLKPERTTALEISYKRTFKTHYLVSFTYFKKEISGLVDSKTFLASDSKYEDDGFTQYVNMPTATSSGFELLLEKEYSNYFSGKICYTLMNAKGYSNYVDQGLNYQMWGFAIPNVEHYLSWDQRHTFVMEAFAGVPGKYGIDMIWRWNSPRPYTYYPSRTGYLPDLETQIEPNNARMKNIAYVDVKLYKEWAIFKGMSVTTYLDIRNLFDRKNVLWIASDGKTGGELEDPSAWDVGRRLNVGLKIALGTGND